MSEVENSGQLMGGQEADKLNPPVPSEPGTPVPETIDEASEDADQSDETAE